MAALVEAHAEDGVARLEHGQVGGQVGVGAGVRLDVGVLGAEELARPAAGQVLGLVDDLVAAVVALARVALRVLVGEHRPGGGHHRSRGEILRRDELQGGVLPLLLAPDDVEELAILGHDQQSRAWVAWHTGPGPVAQPSPAPARRRPPARPAGCRRWWTACAGPSATRRSAGSRRTSPWSRRSTSGATELGARPGPAAGRRGRSARPAAADPRAAGHLPARQSRPLPGGRRRPGAPAAPAGRRLRAAPASGLCPGRGCLT